MTRDEEIRQAARNYFDEYMDGLKVEVLTVQQTFEHAAKCADETMIEKAEKWLENFLEKTIKKPSINDGYTSDTIEWAELKRHRLIEEVLCDFKKAMEL